MFKQRCFRLLLLASAIATSLSAAAYSFESAGIYYNITGDNTVEVTYSDRNNNTYSGSISICITVGCCLFKIHRRQLFILRI